MTVPDPQRLLEIAMLIDLSNVIRGALAVAVEDGPAAGISLIGDFLEEAGVEPEDVELRQLLDAWWAQLAPPAADAALAETVPLGQIIIP